MSKRRTRKQKESARHQVSVSWSPSPKRSSAEANVKGQIDSTKGRKLSRQSSSNNPNNSDYIINIATIKKEIKRSLFLASTIVAMELVLYLVWH
ncbi:hypothetical protein A2115_03255 [Candidatus Woesebacteria bacterium GWA1_41_8]|jgi:hypothetical protein|uniref:Uncharacterized protein n=1 Tax=Candidatus Woesebacteria bacterium GWA1_41_8 TaxID=1802471 RepID=A0A1F7WHS4_9BACT|nr:MAG: hypothetical protein A2115_03255 [Candidatus Woesebacteria bacterium GWA1_41_8]